MIDTVRRISFAHPRVRGVLKEVWGASRRLSRITGLPAIWDFAELRDLRRVRDNRSGVVRPAGPGSPRILFLTMRGWSSATMWEVTLAQAARARGAEPVFAICGGRLPICDAANFHSAPPMPCLSCREYAEEALRLAGFAPTTLGDLVDLPAEIKAATERAKGLVTIVDCEAFAFGGLPIGRLVRISVAWFLARGSLTDEPRTRDTYRAFIVSGQVVAAAFARLLDEVKPDRVFMINGKFYAEQILIELARAQSIPVTTYERGFITDSLVFAHDEAAVDLIVDRAAWATAAVTPLTTAEEDRLDSYLDARTRGERASDPLWPSLQESLPAIRAELKLSPDRSIVTLFPNILWDSAVQERDIAFASMTDWVVQTIEGFAQRPSVDLVVRIHPAEVALANHRSAEQLAPAIAALVPQLPANVRVVGPESPISSYSLMAASSLGLVYTSTAGLEMAIRGIPVVLAAETHYRGLGFTIDVDTAAAYWSVVDECLAPGGGAGAGSHTDLARRYANLFFFRYMQPFAQVREISRGRPRLTYASVEELKPGADPVLDRIMHGILDGAAILAPEHEAVA